MIFDFNSHRCRPLQGMKNTPIPLYIASCQPSTPPPGRTRILLDNCYEMEAEKNCLDVRGCRVVRHGAWRITALKEMDR